MASSTTTITSRADAGKASAAEKAPANGAADSAVLAAPATSKFKEYLPLMANIILMPVLAYAMTAFVLVPKLAKKSGGSEAAHNAAAAETPEPKHESGKSGKADESDPKDPVTGKTKISVPLSKKTLVNVSGTMGTRYLLAEFVLVGTNPNFKTAVEKADAELRDAAMGTLATKTINDLEKPGIRNLIRSELMTIFNSILGKGMVSEIYLTEFAIQ